MIGTRCDCYLCYRDKNFLNSFSFYYIREQVVFTANSLCPFRHLLSGKEWCSPLLPVPNSSASSSCSNSIQERVVFTAYSLCPFCHLLSGNEWFSPLDFVPIFSASAFRLFRLSFIRPPPNRLQRRENKIFKNFIVTVFLLMHSCPASGCTFSASSCRAVSIHFYKCPKRYRDLEDAANRVALIDAVARLTVLLPRA
jgi:hypothetical protein